MSGHSMDQKGSLLPFVERVDRGQHQNPAQYPVEQGLSSSSQHLQTEDVDTAGPNTHPVPADQAETKSLGECRAYGFDSNISLTVPISPHEIRDSTAVCESGRQTPLLAPSTLTLLDHSDVSTAVAPTHQISSNPPKGPYLMSSATELRSPPRMPLSESLGFGGCRGIIGGFVGILGCFGFLEFLWFGRAKYTQDGTAPEAAEATGVWRQLALQKWMPPAVTLTSITLRSAIGIQATICTSMLAALLLERLSVPRSQVAYASVIRAINDGPWKLVKLLFSYKGNASYIIWHLEAWLIILVALLSLALQFTSTILIRDMHLFSIVGDLTDITVHSLFAFPVGGNGSLNIFKGSLMGSDIIYPVFGEVPTTHNSSPDARGFSDTGLKQRGLLPMSLSENRTSVREFKGMSMVMSSRVACMRPIITNASLDVEHRLLRGVLDYSQSLQEARPGTGPLCTSSNDCEQVAFQCGAVQVNKKPATWASTGCVINGVGGHFRGPWKPMWDPANGPWAENSLVWLIYSTNMRQEEWKSLSPNYSMPPGQPFGDSEWTSYEIVPGYFIDLAVCFSAANFAYRDTRMNTSGETREWSYSWSLDLNKGSNIHEAETYLGLNPWHESFADRGILELQINHSTPYTPAPPFSNLLMNATEVSPSALAVNELQLAMSRQLTNSYTTNTTFRLCQSCSILSNVTEVSDEYAFLFSSLVHGDSHHGGRAADALHAFVNMAGFNLYYQFLSDTMDVAEQVKVKTTRLMPVPGTGVPGSRVVNSAGLIAVGSLLAAYGAVVMVVTVLYVRYTRYSRYGNIWHAISQLEASVELEETLELGNNAGDKAVAKGLQTKELGKGDVLVKLGKEYGCEKIKVKRI